MATKENIKQLYTEDGKTKIYPVVISDSLTTDDGKTTGADAIGKWLKRVHLYAQNLTVSADPSVMDSTDRLAKYQFVETKVEKGSQTMTINMPLTIGANTETGAGNKNGNIIINNVTTSINSSSGVIFRGDKTVMNLNDASNGWKSSTFNKQSGLIINSKNTNNAPSLVIGNRDIFTIDANGKVGSFGNNWFSASSGDISTGNALCLQNEGGDVKIGGSLLVSGNERINGKVRIYGGGTYLDILGIKEPIIDGAAKEFSKIKMQLGNIDMMEMYDVGFKRYLVVKSSFMAKNGASLYSDDSSIAIDSAGSYAKIDYINLGKTTNSKINDTSSWSDIKFDGGHVGPIMKAASIKPPTVEIIAPYKLITDKKKYTFSTAGKTWNSSGIVSSENHIVAINENKEITSLYLNYPTNDVHGGVSVYDLSVKNKAVFNGAVKVTVDDSEIDLAVPVWTIVSWIGKDIPDGWDKWNDKEIYYIGKYASTTKMYQSMKGEHAEGTNKWKMDYNVPTSNKFTSYTFIKKVSNYEYQNQTDSHYFYVVGNLNEESIYYDIFSTICEEYVNKYLKTEYYNNRMCYGAPSDNGYYKVMDNDNILIKYDLGNLYPPKIIKVK